MFAFPTAKRSARLLVERPLSPRISLKPSIPRFSTAQKKVRRYERSRLPREQLATQLGISRSIPVWPDQKTLLEPLPVQRSFRSRRKRLPASQQGENQQEVWPVEALHIAQTINLMPVLNNVFAKHGTLERHAYGKNMIVLKFLSSQQNNEEETIPRYAAVFGFGSIVCLNMTPRQVTELTNDVRKHSLDLVMEGFERKEDYGIVIHGTYSSLGKYADRNRGVVMGDYCAVPELTMNGFAVISNILAQTVALDAYNDTVDDLLANFTRVNSTVTKAGHLSASDKKFLFKTVARNNSVYIDMISKIRIKDRSDTAWNLVEYEDLHYGLKEEFELDSRIEIIESKLEFIHQNSKFFLEVLQDEKNNSLEWAIVVLIALECGLMCVEMSGYGESMFAYLKELVM